MRLLLQALKSRTILTIVGLFIIGGFQAIEGTIPENVYLLVSGVLSVLAIYFRISPKVSFK